MSAAKMGRPTDNPKETRITVRLDSESNKILNEYCDEKQISKADAIREAIKGLKKIRQLPPVESWVVAL